MTNKIVVKFNAVCSSITVESNVITQQYCIVYNLRCSAVIITDKYKIHFLLKILNGKMKIEVGFCTVL